MAEKNAQEKLLYQDVLRMIHRKATKEDDPQESNERG